MKDNVFLMGFSNIVVYLGLRIVYLIRREQRWIHQLFGLEKHHQR